MDERKKLKITKEEVGQMFTDPHWSAKFPPVLTIAQVAELLQIPTSTLYQWKSQGKLVGCYQRTGKHLRFFRNRLILRIFNK